MTQKGLIHCKTKYPINQPNNRNVCRKIKKYMQVPHNNLSKKDITIIVVFSTKYIDTELVYLCVGK